MSKKKQIDEDEQERLTWVGYAPKKERTKRERLRDNERKEKQRRRNEYDDIPYDIEGDKH